MNSLIFFILVALIFIFVLYLGSSAILTGVKAKTENRINKDNNNDLGISTNLTSELKKLDELLKSGALTQEEFDKAKKKILDN